MRFILGILLSFVTLSYWWGGIQGVYEQWLNLQERPDIDAFGTKNSVVKIRFIIILIIIFPFFIALGIYLIKWSLKFLGLSS